MTDKIFVDSNVWLYLFLKDKLINTALRKNLLQKMMKTP